MNKLFMSSTVAASLFLLAMLIVGARAQSAKPAGAAKSAGETFKNVQVLKDIPADEIQPTMRFISASLGVGCDYCHVPGAFEKDDKDEKKAARAMIQMMFAINREHFEGHREVTCYSCHHGETDPAKVPALASAEAKPAAPANTANLPSIDQVLEKYVQALGGADALKKVSSFAAAGTVTAGPRKFPIEIFAKAPDKRVSAVHFPPGDMVTVFDGTAGWQLFPGQPAHDLPGSETDAARLDADLLLPLQMKQIFGELKVEGQEKVGNHDTFVVIGRREGMPPMTFYFDSESGLLVRRLHYVETVLGRIPIQTDYEDYRDASGVKFAYHWTTAQPGRSTSIQLDKLEVNTPVDDGKFAKPEAAGGQ